MVVDLTQMNSDFLQTFEITSMGTGTRLKSDGNSNHDGQVSVLAKPNGNHEVCKDGRRVSTCMNLKLRSWKSNSGGHFRLENADFYHSEIPTHKMVTTDFDAQTIFESCGLMPNYTLEKQAK